MVEEREQQLLEENTMERISLIRSLSELDGTCYFEILPGKYEGNCWNQNSVFITEEIFGYFEPVFERHEPDFDHYAFMAIGKDVWTLIISDFSNLMQVLEQSQDVQELEGKVGFVFRDSMCRFASDFRSNAMTLAGVLRELSEWLEEQLKNHDCISVLGI
ncbi:hypothetical protein [Nostoc flagelliforme]|uniref:hypothetical protein n=1 Tax=Nostoc flagelliforme TaxID=1306274 RepID=UPI0016832AA6|nr:hypothetical protein [Nostoc flagelliforme]